MEPEVKEEGGIDMEAAVASIGEDLFGAAPEEEAVVAEPVVVEAAKSVVVEPRAAPQSWAKDKAEVWSKLPPEAQEQVLLREKQMLDGLEQYKENNGFGKTLKEVYAPYKALLNAQNVDEVKATQYFLNTHHKLTTGSPESRMAAYQALGAGLGLVAAPNQPVIDPALAARDARLDRLESSLTERQQRDFEAHRAKVATEVSSFAAENPYFDEVSEDIVHLIGVAQAKGESPDLKSIYDKAVWANPVTRQKELTRTQQENEKALREKSKQEAKAAREAASSNVRSRDTRKAPTEPLGKMEDTMRETLKTIKSRDIH